MTKTAWQRLLTFSEGLCQRSSHHATVLGDSLTAFQRYSLQAAPDGYPVVEGDIQHRSAKISFIPDTLELKRLPQLWLSIALRSERQFAPVILTARPRGDDYVSLGSRSSVPPIPPPAWLPHDFGLRGGHGTLEILNHLREPLEAIFSDSRMKEMAFIGSHLRLLYRLAQGRRGSHLIFRQPVFEEALSRATLQKLVGALSTLDTAIASLGR